MDDAKEKGKDLHYSMFLFKLQKKLNRLEELEIYITVCLYLNV